MCGRTSYTRQTLTQGEQIEIYGGDDDNEILMIIANIMQNSYYSIEILRFIKFLIIPEHLIPPSGVILIFLRMTLTMLHVVARLPALRPAFVRRQPRAFHSSLPVSFLTGSLLGSTSRHVTFPSAEDSY